MRELLEQIQQALNYNLYYLAFYSSLTIPDICAGMESEDGQTSSSKYIKWFNTYASKYFRDNLDGFNCYKLRCSVLHQGRSRPYKYKKVIFAEPNSVGSLYTDPCQCVFHNTIIDDVLVIDVRIFCQSLIVGAEEWLKNKEDTEIYKKNYEKLMKRYPNGIPPYIVGCPVIG